MYIVEHSNLNEMKALAGNKTVIVFHVADQAFALPVTKVDRILRIVEITPPPSPKPFLMGFVDIEGNVVPVINTWLLFGINDRDIELSDHLILVQGPLGQVALWVEEGTNIYTHNPSRNVENQSSPSQRHLSADVLQTKQGLIFVHEPDTLLSFLMDNKVEKSVCKTN